MNNSGKLKEISWNKFLLYHTSLIEKFRKFLLKSGFSGILMTDFFKVFNFIDHELLIAKMHAYGIEDWVITLTDSAVTLTGLRRKELYWMCKLNLCAVRS